MTPPARPLVLIVDDNPPSLRLMRHVLAAGPFELATADDASTALALIAARRPALILMDVQLPGVDGLTLTRQLKADPATRDIVVIAVTASAMVGDDARALAAGCDGYVAKPIDTRAMPSLVEAWLARGPRPA